MADKLKPCPFCGSGDIAVEDLGGDDLAHVVCKSCRAEGPAMPTWAEAINAWERRAGDGKPGDGEPR